ncbi:MAG: CoA pyrophosphatase [Dehalococcoidia bacterium]|nr:CoA pyrophosphatase [Dehalococcoidia bacterium]
MVDQEDLFAAIKDALGRARWEARADPALKPAAVLVLLTTADDVVAVAFTQRTSHVEHHKGEVSFPGGARDPEDADHIATALRETHEEIGIPAASVRVLGQLAPAVTRSNFLMHPVVGSLVGPAHFIPNPFEVAEVFTVPLRALLDPATKREEAQTRNGVAITSVAYYHNGHRIWGATARVLTGFLDIVAKLPLKEGTWASSSQASRR